MDLPKSEQDLLTEEQILAMPEEDYMNAEQLAFFKNKLMELHDSTRERIREARDQVASPMSESDANDRASNEEQSSIALRIADREQKLLPKIQQSLERIRTGEYGFCLESGEPIGVPRLLARPTAEYCAEVKALKEVKERNYYN